MWSGVNCAREIYLFMSDATPGTTILHSASHQLHAVRIFRHKRSRINHDSDNSALHDDLREDCYAE